MSVQPGARLGPYEIVAPLGAGGMGEVHRARDPRLGRDVAIKVLPAAFSADADRLRRFEQEARAAAALNHPNILAVHDIGTHDGAPYIVSELLEGETLRERLARGTAASGSASAPGGLSVRKAIDHAIQIAHGLSGAHDKGIVHRDLKPENLFVTADGRVKILDFGLAKLRPDLAPSGGGTGLPTEAVGTQPGMLLGTMGYMAPEQVRGHQADHRSDIFAFGAVLYEMLSGQRAFRGATAADTISAILDKDPQDLPVVERHIPPALERIVDRCLEKSPSARFQTASDLAFALEALSSHSDRSEASGVVAGPAPARPSRERLAWGVAALLAVSTAIAFALGAMGYFTRPRLERAYRSTVLLPEKAVYTSVGTPAYRLGMSPDGSRVSFVAAMDGQPPRLWVRPLDALSAQPLAGTEQAAGPFWSPDSRFIAYFTTPLTSLKKIDAAGGPPLTLVELPGANPTNGSAGATWNKDDVILFGATGPVIGGPIRRVSAAGGSANEVIAPDTKNGETELWYPYFLPDGNHFLYLAMGPLDGLPLRPLGIYATALDGKERKLIMRGGSNMKYVQGHLLFLREGTLMAQPFDAERLALSGDAVPIAEQVQIGGPSGATGPFAVSETGVLAYVSGPGLGAGTPSQLAWFDREGKRLGELGDRASYSDVELSHDGTRATVSVIDSARRSNDIWIYDVARGLRTKFTFDSGSEQTSVWSPDGSRIVYNSTRNPPTLYQNASTGSGTEDMLPATASSGSLSPTSWSSDGRFICYIFLAAAGVAARPRHMGAAAVRRSEALCVSPDARGRSLGSVLARWALARVHVQ